VAQGAGLAIGSCLSQWAANLYLDGLDQFIKRVLKVKPYLAAPTDIVIATTGFIIHSDTIVLREDKWSAICQLAMLSSPRFAIKRDKEVNQEKENEQIIKDQRWGEHREHTENPHPRP
jgi:hypothetical protein